MVIWVKFQIKVRGFSGEEGAKTLHTNLSSFVKSVVFTGNGLGDVTDLCELPASYFEDSKSSNILMRKSASNLVKPDPRLVLRLY